MSKAAVATRGNVSKYTSFAWAIDRMKTAHGAGFFLETIAIAESILSDRIWSHVKGVTGGPARAKEATLGKILTFKGAFKASAPEELYDAVAIWADGRNKVLHGVVKSYAGTAPMPLEEFKTLAGSLAAEALVLVPKVNAWHRRVLREHLKGRTEK